MTQPSTLFHLYLIYEVHNGTFKEVLWQDGIKGTSTPPIKLSAGPPSCPLPPKGSALALAKRKNSSNVIILSSTAAFLHSFTHPRISDATSPLALKKSEAGIGVEISIRCFGLRREGRTRW